eukprot:TRINITY_DN7211_c0_g2_i1.p1 TRINITY_DN7211_c0_g2~~TRINITY_DN7211_c0_g2_i1.p1  ORF type:complete len:397 (-),score=85.78 TRINITY_DN7211_c0_g2_i1:725-1855(-)
MCIRDRHEDMGKFGEAKELYKKIKEENHLYTDAYVRLAFLARRQGEYQKALEYCDEALEILEKNKQKNDLPLCFKGNVLFEIGDDMKAIQSFKRAREDSYAKLACAQIEYEASCNFRDNFIEQKKYLRAIRETCREIISTDESNVYAAIGLGIVLAEYGKLTEAKNIFNSLLESSQNNYSLLVNLGHIDFLNEQYDNAISIYSTCLKKHREVPDDYLEMCLAITYYFAKKFKDAQRLFRRLVLRNPDNLVYRYNLAVSLQDHGKNLLKQENRDVAQTKQALTYFSSIQKMFDFLISNDVKENRLRYEIGKLGKKKEALYNTIRMTSDTKKIILDSNIGMAKKELEEDEQRQHNKILTKEERKKLIEKIRRRGREKS